MSIGLKAVLSLLVLAAASTNARAQADSCTPDGIPAGSAWVICLNPWAPAANEPFELNFSGPFCALDIPDEFVIDLASNTYRIYYTYAIQGCLGVPPTPRLFSQQSGVPAGNYTVQLYERQVEEWPPPPFDPAEFNLIRQVSFAVQGTPAPPVAVPALGWIGAIILGLGLLLGIAHRLRSGRSQRLV